MPKIGMMVATAKPIWKTALMADGPVLGCEADYRGDPVLYQELADHKHGMGLDG